MRNQRSSKLATLLAASCALCACGDDGSGSTGGGGSGTTSTSASTTSSSSSTSTTSSSSSTSSTSTSTGAGGAGGAGEGGQGGDGGMGQGGDGGMGQGGDGGMGQGGAGGGGSTAVTSRAVRVGQGVDTLSNASAPVYLEERDLSGNLVGAPILLPTAANGAQQAFTLSGTATSEGALTRSADGKYLVLAGYATGPGLASVGSTTTSAVQRVIARVDASGSVDTSTRLDTAFSGNNVRSAVSSDGTSFWAAGNGSGGTGGVYTIGLGATGGTQVLASPSNLRVVQIFAGQLYGSSGAGAFTNVFTIGTGLPTAAGATATSLPGMPTSAASPFAYALLDRSAAVPGLDTLYVADDRALSNGGGVQRYTLTGGTWVLGATLTGGLGSGVRGLAAFEQGAEVVLVLSTAANPSELAVLTDDGSSTGTGSVVAVADANTQFRGVALSPE